MIVVDKSAGIAIDFARIYVGTESEPDEDGKEVVVTMNIGDDLNDVIFEYESGPYRAKTRMFIPLDRLKQILAEV
jgi:hypothetical protein